MLILSDEGRDTEQEGERERESRLFFVSLIAKREREKKKRRRETKKTSTTGKNLSSFNALMSMFPAVGSE